MRSHEFINDDYNRDTIRPGFTAEKMYKDRYLLRAVAADPKKETYHTPGLRITAYDSESDDLNHRDFGVGSALFLVHRNHMRVYTVWVYESYRRQGIASAIYNFARELGNEVRPSSNQTDLGKAFWAGGAGIRQNSTSTPSNTQSLPVENIPPVSIQRNSWLDRLFNLFGRKDKLMR